MLCEVRHTDLGTLGQRGSSGGSLLDLLLVGGFGLEGVGDLIDQGDAELELRLCLCGSVQLFVDRCVGSFKCDISGRRVGESFDSDGDLVGDVQEVADLDVVSACLRIGQRGEATYLAFEGRGRHVTQGHLGPAGDALNDDLEGDRVVGGDDADDIVGGHGDGLVKVDWLMEMVGTETDPVTDQTLRFLGNDRGQQQKR